MSTLSLEQQVLRKLKAERVSVQDTSKALAVLKRCVAGKALATVYLNAYVRSH